ncbi:hypothetical protein OG21DRAFT_1501387 [Imleria badia]|nr:hypothetical protein OG21DRAFT_1501387 [Imleria badia]
MSQNHLDSDNAAAVKSPDVQQEDLRRFHANLRAFFSRSFALVCEPRLFAPLAVDFWLLLQSFWSGKKPGPDLVYPMLSIRKRQSGRLARLMLEHCRAVHLYELLAATSFPNGIDPPCVAVVNLDEVPQNVVESGYSTQFDLYGLMCILMLFSTFITTTVHVFYLFDGGLVTWFNWVCGAVHILIFCWIAATLGNGTLTPARRSDTSTPGYAVLPDQDFTVVLNGNTSIVEAIAESNFTLSHPNSVPRSVLKDHGRHIFHGLLAPCDLLEALCEAACLTILMSCCLLLRHTTREVTSLTIVISTAFLGSPPPWKLSLSSGFVWLFLLTVQLYPPLLFEATYMQAIRQELQIFLLWHSLPLFLFWAFVPTLKGRDYPIRSGKYLDALGHPEVRKWQFDTLVAAATFQCLVLCRGIARPIRSIDVSAFLDMLVPDQRDLWKAWKARVADRIVHETGILFSPTIPTFGDERQQQLKDLLDQAQFGYDMYRQFYDRQ